MSLDTIKAATTVLNTPELKENNFRAAPYWPFEYEIYKDFDNSEISWIPCLAILDRKKFSNYDSFWGTYNVEIGVRAYLDASDRTASIPLFTQDSFEVVLAAPSYEFGDAFEKTDEPYAADSVIDEVVPFDLTVFGEAGTGFVRTTAGFTVIPNMGITFWTFRFTIEMPTEYYADGNQYFVNRVTYNDQSGTVPKSTVICATNFGDPYLVDTVELNSSWDKTVGSVSGQKAFPELAGDSVVEGSGYARSWDLKDYTVTEAANGKSRLGCIVRSEISPEEVGDFFDKTYDVELESRVYESKDSANFKGLPAMSFTMMIPAPEFEFEVYDDDVAAKQKIDEKSFSFDAQAATGVAGTVNQFFYPGFVTDPYDETKSD